VKKLLLITIALYSFLNADVAPGILRKYKNNIFICTHTGSCRNVEMALYADFVYIYGIEEDEVLANHAKLAISSYIKYIKPKKFKKYFVYHGYPIELLPKVLRSIKEPATILLNSYLPEIDHPEKKNFILKELANIKNHPINTHTILIDYVHLAGTQHFGSISLESIKKMLLTINPGYKFRFEKGGHLRKEEKAILVAYLK